VRGDYLTTTLRSETQSATTMRMVYGIDGCREALVALYDPRLGKE
jgi:hypothetical protein